MRNVGKRALSFAFSLALILGLAPALAVAADAVADPAAKIGENGYETLQAALTAAKNGEIVTLQKDVTETISFSGEGDADEDGNKAPISVTLDLNDHSITAAGDKESSVITVSKGTLIVKDGAAEKTTHYYTVTEGVATVNDSSGEHSFTGGYITGGKGTYNDEKAFGGGVYVAAGAAFTLQSGTIIGNTTTHTQASGETGKNDYKGAGGGVYVAAGAKFEMTGGKILGNTAKSVDYGAQGGGVYVEEGAESNADATTAFIMSAGEISYNSAVSESEGLGGGICVMHDSGKKSGTISITGGEIKNNTGTKGGGVAFSADGSVKWTASGLTVTGNTATQGGGVHVGSVYLTLDSCTVTGNTASEHGGGVYVNDESFLTPAGTLKVTDNTVKAEAQDGDAAEGKADNVYLEPSSSSKGGFISGDPTFPENSKSEEEEEEEDEEGRTATFGAISLSKGASIGVTLGTTAGTGVFTNATNAKDVHDYFSSDNTSYFVGIVAEGTEANQLEIASKPAGEHKHGDIVFDAWDKTASLPTSGNYYLLYDVTLTEETKLSDTLNLCLNGKTVTKTRGSTGLIISVGSNTLSIYDDAEKSGQIISDNRAVINVKGGTLNIYGGTITGSANSDNAAVQGLDGSGTINMTGGKIVARYSNAFSLGSGTVLNLTGGAIESTSEQKELDVSSAVLTNSAFTGTINLSGTTITTKAGSGIYTRGSRGTVNITNASIHSESDYAINGSAQGTLNVSGDLKNLNGGLGGIYLLAGKKITVTDSLSGSVKVVTAATPTAASPVVITSGLSGHGTVDNFTCDEEYTVAISATEADEVEIRVTSEEPEPVKEKEAPPALANFTVTANPTTPVTTDGKITYANPESGPAFANLEYRLGYGEWAAWPETATLEGLAAGDYYFRTKAPADKSKTASDPVGPLTLEASTRLEELKITSATEGKMTNEVGAVLNAVTNLDDSLGEDTSLSYAWYRVSETGEVSTEPVGTEKTYTLTEDDRGGTVMVKVTWMSGETSLGSLSTSTPTIITESEKPAAYGISGGRVLRDNSGVGGATVELRQGNTVVATTTSDAVTGAYAFTGIPAGDYNIVVTTADGKTTKTEHITVTGDMAAPNVNLPSAESVGSGSISSKVVVTGSTPAVVIGSLDEEAAKQIKKDSDVVVKLTVESRVDLTETPPAEDSDDYQEYVEQTDIKTAAKAPDGTPKDVEFLDMAITSTVTTSGVTTVSDINETSALLQIIIPYDTSKFYNVAIYRYHEGNGLSGVQEITSTPNGNGEYIAVSANRDSITLFVKYFSTYAIGYTTEEHAAPVTPTYPSGGGGGVVVGTVTYAVTVDTPVNGTVKADKTSAAPGAKVTLTVIPDAGYQVESVTVTDKDGKTVAVTKNADGTYTFTQPSGKVTVRATFTEVIAAPVDPGVGAWLITDAHIVYFTGYEDGTIRPEGQITRAETAAIFYRLLKDKNAAVTVSFSDVASGAWYAEAVNALASMGVILGYEDGNFRPQNPITRAEFAAIATRFANAVDGGMPYTDVPETLWAYGNIAAATAYGWIEGYEDNTFRPTDNITRAEAAKIINRMLGRSADAEYVAAHQDELARFSDLQDPAKWYYLDMIEASTEHYFTITDGVEKWNR